MEFRYKLKTCDKSEENQGKLLLSLMIAGTSDAYWLRHQSGVEVWSHVLRIASV